MKDYQPIDLTSLCNVGAAFDSDHGAPPLGAQVFQGLPFQIGPAAPNAENCFLGFNGEGAGPGKPVTIPIGAAPRTVIVAHRIVGFDPMKDQEAFGDAVAHYVFRFADGAEERVPIRVRFEITNSTKGDGVCAAAMPTNKEVLLPRYEGKWGGAGGRQTEVNCQRHTAYLLWTWKNPRPGEKVESVTIEPAQRKFYISAITLGFRDEWPFYRTGREPLKISLPQAEDAEKPFALEVEVDRGVATYPYALPKPAEGEFPGGGMPGWGQPHNAASSPAYVEIAAVPSATVTVKSGGESLGQANWGELQEKGKIETPRAHFEVVEHGRNWAFVTVVDEATNKPLPCRIHFRSPQGVPYQPHGHQDHINSDMGNWHFDVGGDLRLGNVTYAYIDGQCQGWLPRGELFVDAAKGYEYEPLQAKLQIKPGQRELTLRMKRWIDMNERRWFSGDSHVHFLGTQGAHLEAQGEGLSIVNLLQSQWGSLFTNTEDYTGGPSVSADGRSIVYCSQENRQHYLGHMILWGLKHPVMPWCTDGPGEGHMGGTMENPMAWWSDECRKQGGTVIIPHFPFPNGEPASLIATGRVDALEMTGHGNYAHHEYYRYLNCGYRVPLVGGTDKMSSDVPVGMTRTYAYIPADQEFNYENWCAAVKAGRTFISAGPMIEFTVNGARAGDMVKLSGKGTVEIEAWAESVFPIHTLQIVQQGKVVASTDEAKGARRLVLKTSLKVDGNTWLAARCAGPDYNSTPHFDCWKRGIFAHTSPVYVAVGGEWDLFDAPGGKYMMTMVESALAYVRYRAATYPAGTATHHHGEVDHQAFLERFFLQAKDALHKKMHKFGIGH